MERNALHRPGRRSRRSLWLGLAVAQAAVLVIVVLLLLNRAMADPDVGPSVSYEGTALNRLAADFRLQDQHGRIMALSDFAGQIAVLSFLDPRCTDVCPLLALTFQELVAALGPAAARVTILAVNTNPGARSVAAMATATAQWQMDRLANWHFLTGEPADLQAIWDEYGISAGAAKPGKRGEVQHTDGVYLIDQAGRIRWYISIPLTDPGWDGPPLSELVVLKIRRLLEVQR